MATGEQIQDIYIKLRSHDWEYERNEAYVKGRNPDILSSKKENPPDNRVPLPLAKMAVEDLTGYAARPGDINIYFDNIAAEGEGYQTALYNNMIQTWQENNEDDLHISELYTKMLTHGKSYELFWTVPGTLPGQPLDIEWKRINYRNMYIEYSQELKPKKTAAYYFRKYEEADIVNIYYPYYYQIWIREQNKDWFLSEEDAHPFSAVPVIEYTGSTDKLPFFEAEKELIDAQDKLISKAINEIDRFNALKLLFPGEVTKEFVKKLSEMNVIDDLEKYDAAKFPQYLEKNLSGVEQFYNTLADRLERMFHKSIKIPDFTSQTFASGDESGVARAFKLLGMEFKAAMIETYFNRGLKARKILFDDVINLGSNNLNTEAYKTKVENKRNIPLDEVSKVQIAVQLKGLVSDETLLRFLPETIVDDIDKELLATKENREEMRKELGFLNSDDNE